ncbi:MAG: hypothetical protein ACLFUO_05640 [Candidatus Woesearchaeota archaeon]
MKLSRFIILGVLLVVILSSASYLIMKDYYIYDIVIIPADLEVNDYVGFNLDNDALHFGSIKNQGNSRRNITVINTYGKTSLVVIEAEGEIASWISASENSFLLEEDTSRQVEFMIETPEFVDYGNYTGNVTITFKRP